MEPLPVDNTVKSTSSFGKDFKNYARNTLSKRTSTEEAVQKFSQFCTLVVGEEVNLSNYDTDLSGVVESFAANQTYTTNQHVWLIKATLHLIKVMHKKEEKLPSEDILPLLNKWQANFWNPSLKKHERRGIFLDLQSAVKPLFYIKLNDSDIFFDKKENEDRDKLFSENIEKLVSHDFDSLEDLQKWSINHTIKNLSNSIEEEDSHGQKISLALKRSALSLHDIVEAKHTKVAHSENTMISCLKSIFESNAPSTTGYSVRDRNDINKLLQIFSRSYDSLESIKAIYSFIAKVEDIIPSTLLNPSIKRNFIGFTYTVLENLVKERPDDFYEEFFQFLKLALSDLKAEAEESTNDFDSLFLENYQRCYQSLPQIILIYSQDDEKFDQIVAAFCEEFKNAKLSMYQLNILFTTLGLVARSKNAGVEDAGYFSIELSSKKANLSVCALGSLADQTNSIIMSLKRSIDTNTISFEIKGKHSKKFKVDDSINKSLIRVLLSDRPGVNRDGIHKWVVLGEGKVPEGVLYTQIAYYVLLHGKTSAEKLDRKHLITDTLLNFSLTNHATLSRFSIHTIASLSHHSEDFFQNVVFQRLSIKMIQYNESLEAAELEKSSDLVLHPHKARSARRLISSILNTHSLNLFNNSIECKQEKILEPNGLSDYLISISSPALYNFNMKGNFQHLAVSQYIQNVTDHYSERGVDFKDILEKISKDLVTKLASKEFIFSTNVHRRMIAINVCGGLGGVSPEFYEIVSQTFRLKPIIDQVKKCLKCKELFKEQYPRIPFYDMNHISDSAAALIKVFEDKLKAIEEIKEDEEEEVEEVKVSTQIKTKPKKEKDMNKLLLGGIGLGKGKKKGKKGGNKKDAGKKSTKKAETKPKPKEVAAEPPKPPVEENKEERTIRDLNTVNHFLEYTFNNACTFVDSILSIYELASKGSNNELLDNILYQNMHTLIELLRYPSCNFILKRKLPKLLENSTGNSIIHKMKDSIIECLLLSSKLLDHLPIQKSEVDKPFKIFFNIMCQDNINFSNLGRGMIRLILTNINFAIKHNVISQSLKESALDIGLKILESSEVYDPIDMLRVGQSLLKQDYVSELSFKFLTSLFTKITDVERIVMCSRVFDYHSLQLPNFFDVIYNYDKPLPRSENFEVQCWIKQYDEEPINKKAQKVWNKYYSNVDVIEKGRDKKIRIKNFSQYALDSFGSVSRMTTDAFVAAINIDGGLLLEYIKSIDKIIDSYPEQTQKDEQLKFFASVINSVSNLIDESQLEKLFEFIVYEGYLNKDQDISVAFERCGISVCIEQGKKHSKEILKILKNYLLNPLNKRTDLDSKKEQLVLNESLVLISSLAKHFDKSDDSTLDIYERIIEMLNIPNQELKKSISKCISPLSRLLESKSKKFLKQLLTMLQKTKDLSTLSGAAFAISGIVKGLGLRTIDQYEILDTLEKLSEAKQSTPYVRVALLNCYEAFSFTLGKTFELYLERVVPRVLDSFSDAKNIVRNAGKNALDTIMLNISGFCVKKIISTIFLKGIEEANWRTKLGQIEALCSMAMFAPNQVAVHLPKVISSIRAILLDTHPKVQEAGQDALNKITSAMRNQGRLNALAILEVHSEQIAKSSATENLTKALDHLLETTFVHSLDEPSLALLMPLIKDGLEAVNRKVQIKALRIIGHICSITNEPSIIAPYLSEIAPIMVNLLLTVHPKLRSASCKALAGIVKGLGLKKCIGTLKWICKMLREASVAESKNVTEAYEEIMPASMDPEDIWKEELSDIESLCISDDSSNRVAGITLLVDYHRFMSCFKNHAGCQINFTEYVNKVLPMFQNALLDTNEDVRSAAVKGMKLGIETFGEDYPDLLFKQLLRGYNHGNYWIRYHTIVLLSTLLHVLGGDIHKIKPDEEKKQEGVITCYEDVISAIYILSFDSVERVSFTASSAWQLFVEKRQGRNLVAPFNDSKEALRTLIFNMIKVISCEYQEVAHSGKRALNSLMGKIFVKLLDESFDIINAAFEGVTDGEAIKRFDYFQSLIEACDEGINKYRSIVEALIGKMIIHDNIHVKNMSSEVFKAFRKTLNNEDFVRDFLKDNF